MYSVWLAELQKNRGVSPSFRKGCNRKKTLMKGDRELWRYVLTDSKESSAGSSCGLCLKDGLVLGLLRSHVAGGGSTGARASCWCLVVSARKSQTEERGAGARSPGLTHRSVNLTVACDCLLWLCQCWRKPGLCDDNSPVYSVDTYCILQCGKHWADAQVLIPGTWECYLEKKAFADPWFEPSETEFGSLASRTVRERMYFWYFKPKVCGNLLQQAQEMKIMGDSL